MIKTWRLPVILLVALTLGACGGNEVDWNGSNIEGVMPDLTFDLTAGNGSAVSEQDFEGTASLLFFGFMNCPDICPGTLQGLSTAISALPAEQQDDIQVLFISVDPERDTPGNLKAYTEFFGPQFTGLTGTKSQLDELVKRMRATYGFGEPDANGYYDVSHSSAIYGFDAEGHARVLMRGDLPVSAMTADIQRLL